MDSEINIIRKNPNGFKKKPNLININKFTSNFSWEKAESEMEYFKDGKINLAYNAIDRYVKNKRGNKIALFYKGINGENEKYTFKQLSQKTNQFANLLKKIGVRKNDKVFIFLPTIPDS